MFGNVAAVLLGLLVGVLAIFALMMWADAREARDDAQQAAALVENQPAASEAQPAASGHDHAAQDYNTALPIESFVGNVPEDAPGARRGAHTV